MVSNCFASDSGHDNYNRQSVAAVHPCMGHFLLLALNGIFLVPYNLELSDWVWNISQYSYSTADWIHFPR